MSEREKRLPDIDRCDVVRNEPEIERTVFHDNSEDRHAGDPSGRWKEISVEADTAIVATRKPG